MNNYERDIERIDRLLDIYRHGNTTNALPILSEWREQLVSANSWCLEMSAITLRNSCDACYRLCPNARAKLEAEHPEWYPPNEETIERWELGEPV